MFRSRTEPRRPVASWVAALLYLCAPLASMLAATADATGTLELVDRGQLHGTLRILATNRVEWIHPAAQTPIVLRPESVSRIRFTGKAPTSNLDGGSIQFRNGDEVRGRPLTVDGREVELESALGRLKAPRTSLRSILFHRDTAIDPGMEATNGWRGQAWTVRDGTFVANGLGPLGRRFSSLNDVSVAFDIVPREDFGLLLDLYAASPDQIEPSPNSYFFLFDSGGFRPVRPNDSPGEFDLVRIPELLGDDRVHLEIRVEPERGDLSLYVDGKLRTQWRDPRPFTPTGNSVVILPRNTPPISLTIANLQVSALATTTASIVTPEKLAPDEAAVRLVNGDEFRGRPVSIADGLLKLSSLELPLSLPLSRVSAIWFHSEPELIRMTKPQLFKVDLVGGNSIAFDLEQWGPEKVVGRSDLFGPISFDPRLVRQVTVGTNESELVPVLPDEFAFAGLRFPTAGAGGADLIQFKNGDRLSGSLDAIAGRQTVRWGSPRFVEAVEFAIEPVKAVDFAKRPMPKPSQGQWLVWLTSGDRLEGRIERIAPDKLLLETSYAGSIEIPRARIRGLTPKPSLAPTTFEGPAGLEGWTSGASNPALNGGAWSYRDGAFYASKSASIARNVGLPDSARIEWDLNWSETLSLNVALYADRLQPVALANKDASEAFGGFYSLQLRGELRAVHLLAITRTNANPNLGEIPLPKLAETNAAHVEVLVSKNRGTIALRIDGQPITEWRDTNGFIGAGAAMRFVHGGQGRVRLGGFRVSDWDGQTEEEVSTARDTKEDRLKLASGEDLGGTLLGMMDGTIRFLAANGRQVSAPVETVRLIELAGVRLDWRQPKDFTARGYFWGGGSIGLFLDEWRDDRLRAHSPEFESAAFLRSAFKRLEFF